MDNFIIVYFDSVLKLLMYISTHQRPLSHIHSQ